MWDKRQTMIKLALGEPVNRVAELRKEAGPPARDSPAELYSQQHLRSGAYARPASTVSLLAERGGRASGGR